MKNWQNRDVNTLSEADEQRLAIKRGANAKKAYEEITTYDVNMISHQGSSAKSFAEMNAMFDGDTSEASLGHGGGNAFYMGRNLGEVGRVDWPEVPGKPEWGPAMKQFSPIFQGVRTEASMSNVHTSQKEVPKYRKEVRGHPSVPPAHACLLHQLHQLRLLTVATLAALRAGQWHRSRVCRPRATCA